MKMTIRGRISLSEDGFWIVNGYILSFHSVLVYILDIREGDIVTLVGEVYPSVVESEYTYFVVHSVRKDIS